MSFPVAFLDAVTVPSGVGVQSSWSCNGEASLECFWKQTSRFDFRTLSFHGADVKMLNEPIAFLVDVIDSATGTSFVIIDGGLKNSGIQTPLQISVVEDGVSIRIPSEKLKSLLDSLENMQNKFQYGLSLERAISSVLQVSSVADYGVRLSHVYNLKDGRLSPDDEPKVFSIAEMLARECTVMLEPYLPMLINMNIM
uniref:DUF3480 domain-containing protein n=1 Tax=Angiostrongylus cantonensis TaxID=6313 RepID=A0A0K0D4G7_ANGCA